MTVVDRFLIWYQQLPASEQNELYAYLVAQVAAQAQVQSHVHDPRFGGRSGQAPRPQYAAVASGDVCPTCHRRIP